MTRSPDFGPSFEALWSYEPFPWQQMLADRLAEGRWPRALDLPTAAGKTACIDAAVWALACQADVPLAERTAPRRVWFVVDRRIVVDEAFSRAQQIAARLREATDGPLKAVADRLRQLGGTERPLAVARLRGGVLQDDGWARIPSQPAVITSTVDQLGSRLLFRGYGRSRLTAPIFAGLAAHDSLILLDEAHCSVPFLQTLQAIERFRGEGWAETPMRTPFGFVILSATPPPSIPASAVFPGGDRERALDHPLLQARTRASKPAELVVVKTRNGATGDPLVAEAVMRASAYLADGARRRVAVMVNRVRTAAEVAARLREKTGDTADVVLLTGRLRPFERDRLVERWQPVLRANRPEEPERPVVVVSTQCLEVGADFSFEALVTEAASLDALRQRFGRLDRLGVLGTAPATILVRDEDAKDGADDPIYGPAIAATWQLLDENAAPADGEVAAKVVDLGIGAMHEVLARLDDLAPYLAPTPDAPSLLPAHLDLLAQTSSPPRPDPDIQPFLHGVGRGSPEVRVVWRADLDPRRPERWAETVALCPPSTAEALSVPLYQLRGWLADLDDQDDLGDVEGAVEGEEHAEPLHGIRPVLIWSGRDRARPPARQATDLRPNDLVVVPAAYGMIPSGQSEPAEAVGADRLDLWEAARRASGRPAALRLHRAVLQPWMGWQPLAALVALARGPAPQRDVVRDAVDAALADGHAVDDDRDRPPSWILELLRAVRNGRIETHPGGGLVLFAADAGRRDLEPDQFADDDDVLSATGQEVPLEVHAGLIERAVRKIADRCVGEGLHEPLSVAARWHDAGKLDERFQLLLRQGDELAAVGAEPLAKSAEIPSSPTRRRHLREASGLPERFRHEMLSLRLAERFAPLPGSEGARDLALHLIASHHGHARPFAPVCRDPTPPSVCGSLAGVTIELGDVRRAALPGAHELRSGIAERYGRLTRRYGWWGLAYLEAVVRLGDWYGSMFSLAGPGGGESQDERRGPGTPAVVSEPAGQALALTGVDGANPLGFLAAVGALRVLHAAGHRGAGLGWRQAATWQPVLTGLSGPAGTGDIPARQAALAGVLAAALRGREVSPGDEEELRDAEKRYQEAKKAVKEKLVEIKERGLRGDERRRAFEDEVSPLENDVEERRRERQTALRKAVPRPETAIGDYIDCSRDEYREHARSFLETSGGDDRDSLDMLADFASDACFHPNRGKARVGTLAPTPFCFTFGASHQCFLADVRQLVTKVTADRVRAMLFEAWQYRDEKHSLRWDPAEDRRYALMDRDPTASDNKARTVWMANLLAYRALALFPSGCRGTKLVTTAWSMNGVEGAFTWPIWGGSLGADTVRFLLTLPGLVADKPDHQALRARGITGLFRARRIKVGSGANYKLSFSQAARV